MFLLIVFMVFAPPESNINGTVFPYLVFLSSNALFTLMALFVWLNPGKYRIYLPLYTAGKIIGVILFYAREFFSEREFSGAEYTTASVFILAGSVFIGMVDAVSIWGAWTLNKRTGLSGNARLWRGTPADSNPAD